MASTSNTLSLSDIIANQERLEEEAAEAIPFSFSNCTYAPAITETRQPIYSCLSCRPSSDTRAGICAGCSVACHGDCELVELFTRRNFTCDCGTTRIPGRQCTITLRENEQPDQDNSYDDNFDGVFCSCKIRYNPATEEDEMVQCLFCENWYHTNKCLAASDTQDLLHADAFDTFVCEGCVLSEANETIGRYAGSTGFMLMRDDGTFLGQPSGTNVPSQPFMINPLAVDTSTRSNGKDDEEEDVSKPPQETLPPPPITEESSIAVASTSTVKRQASPEKEEEGKEREDRRKLKRLKLEVENERLSEWSTCSAPPPPPLPNPLLEKAAQPTKKNVFLAKGWREKFCRCTKCLPIYSKYPFLLEEETVYEPPDDPDSTRSLLELGTDALQKMPREQAIKGLQAYATMKDKLSAFLAPFARDGKVVSKEDMESFFAEQKTLQQQLGQ